MTSTRSHLESKITELTAMIEYYESKQITPSRSLEALAYYRRELAKIDAGAVSVMVMELKGL